MLLAGIIVYFKISCTLRDENCINFRVLHLLTIVKRWYILSNEATYKLE